MGLFVLFLCIKESNNEVVMVEWTLILEIFGLTGGIATVLALVLAPMIWVGSKIDSTASELNSKIDAFRQEVHQDMNEFRKEMTNFHGRLIELETRKKLEGMQGDR